MGDSSVSNNNNYPLFSKTSLTRDTSGKLSYTGVSKNQIHSLFSVGQNGNLIYHHNGEFDISPDVVFDTVNINNYPNSTDISNVATVGYVNNMVQGLDVKDSVRFATTGNISLNSTPDDESNNRDMITGLMNGDRALVKNQIEAKENGIYLVNTNGPWTRALDFDESHEVQGAFVFVEEGTVNGLKGFIQVSNDVVIIGDASLNFTQFNGAYAFEAGDGVTQNGNTLNVDTSLNFVEEMKGLKEVVINGTLDVSGSITGNTIDVLDASMNSAEERLGVLDFSMNNAEGRLGGLDISMNSVENTLNVTGITITEVNINDSSGVYFSDDASFNNVTGNQPASFLVDFSGNLIMLLNNYYFKYNILDVSNSYNGVVSNVVP